MSGATRPTPLLPDDRPHVRTARPRPRRAVCARSRGRRCDRVPARVRRGRALHRHDPERLGAACAVSRQRQGLRAGSGLRGEAPPGANSKAVDRHRLEISRRCCRGDRTQAPHNRRDCAVLVAQSGALHNQGPGYRQSTTVFPVRHFGDHSAGVANGQNSASSHVDLAPRSYF